MSATEPRRILIIRLSAMGDIVMASPIVGALRRAYPQAHLAWLVQPEFEPLLRHHPGLDQVLVWSKGDWRRLWRERRLGELWREVKALRRRLLEAHFDLVLDLQGLLKSGLLARWTRAPERIGLGSREGSARCMTRVVEPGGDPRRIGSEYLFLAQTLGLPVQGFPMQVGLGPEDAARARSLLREEGVDGGYGLICPFTTRPQKHWPKGRWVALAAVLGARGEAPVVMLGGPGDVEPASGLAAACPGLVNLAGKTPLLQTAAVISNARWLIGVDTGLTHLGIAFQLPTVALFGSTRPYLDVPGGGTRVIYHALDCSPCRRRPTCGGRFQCMADIGVDEVLAALDAVRRRP